MADVSKSQVRDVFNTALPDAGLDVYVAMGNDAAEAAAEASDIDTSQENNLARLLVAHYATASDPTARSAATGDTTDDYERPTTNEGGLLETRYGRRAVEYAAVLGIDLVAVIEKEATDDAAFRGVGILDDES